MTGGLKPELRHTSRSRQLGSRSAPPHLHRLHLEPDHIAHGAAEFHPDQVDRLAAIAVLVGIAAGADLPQCLARGHGVHHLELEDADLPGVQHRHVLTG